jgi:hypothetical protein
VVPPELEAVELPEVLPLLLVVPDPEPPLLPSVGTDPLAVGGLLGSEGTDPPKVGGEPIAVGGLLGKKGTAGSDGPELLLVPAVLAAGPVSCVVAPPVPCDAAPPPMMRPGGPSGSTHTTSRFEQ